MTRCGRAPRVGRCRTLAAPSRSRAGRRGRGRAADAGRSTRFRLLWLLCGEALDVTTLADRLDVARPPRCLSTWPSCACSVWSSRAGTGDTCSTAPATPTSAGSSVRQSATPTTAAADLPGHPHTHPTTRPHARPTGTSGLRPPAAIGARVRTHASVSSPRHRYERELRGSVARLESATVHVHPVAAHHAVATTTEPARSNRLPAGCVRVAGPRAARPPARRCLSTVRAKRHRAR